MSYQVRLRRAVQKQLDKLAEHDYRTVAEAISALEQEPRPPQVRKLACFTVYDIVAFVLYN